MKLDRILIQAKPQSIRCHQDGVVLFFALIALLALSLAAVALIRSVDTNTLIAGNLAFKQSTMFSTDSGVQKAMAWVNSNPGSLQSDNQNAGYYATSISTDGAKKLVDDHGIALTVNQVADGELNKISYIVERMCKTTGAVNRKRCLLGPPTAKGNGFCYSTFCPPPVLSGAPVVYRVTARVEGAKGTVSYVQTFVY